MIKAAKYQSSAKIVQDSFVTELPETFMVKRLGTRKRLIKEIFLSIDHIMREVGGFRMGPFELMDLIGIDINLAPRPQTSGKVLNAIRVLPLI